LGVWLLPSLSSLIGGLVGAVDVTTGDLVSGGERGMERRFRVEAKTFFFSTKASQLRLEERRKGFLGLILVDLRRAAWLAATVEEASRSPALVDFDKISSEGRKSLSVRGGSNKGGRFLEVVASVDDDRKGIIWIPEARSGRGWRRFTTELRSLLAALEGASGFSAEESSTGGKVERSPGIISGRSYADAVRSSAGEVDVGLQLRSSQEVDLFPVTSSFELGYDGREVSSAWVCFEVETANLPLDAEVSRPESSLKRLFSTAAADEEKGKMMKEGIMVIRWLWKLLGLAKVDLDRVLDGLQVKPIDCMGLVKSVDSGLEFGLGEVCGLDSEMVDGSVSGPDPGPSVSLNPVWGPVSSGQGSCVASGAGTFDAAIVRHVAAADDDSGNGAGSVFGDSYANADSSAPDAAAVGVVDGSESSLPAPPTPAGLLFPAMSTVSVAGSISGEVDELSRPSEEAESSLTVTGSLLVPSSRFASDDPADDGSSTVSAVDGSSTAVPVGDGFVADTGSPGSAVAISAAGDGFVSAVGDEVAPGLCVSLPDSIFPGVMDSPRWDSVSTSAEECSSGYDTSDESSSPGFAENDLRKESQAWFFGWVRDCVQHDEKLLAKLDFVVERMSRAKLDPLAPDHSSVMLQTREKLASLDAETRQALAIAWLSVQDEE
jgi:hypothetical protein